MTVANVVEQAIVATMTVANVVELVALKDQALLLILAKKTVVETSRNEVRIRNI